MSATASMSAPEGGGRRQSRLPLVLGAILLVVVALVAAAWLNRRAIARETLVGWLRDRGIPAEVEVERIELDGLVARIRVGDPRAPELVVERAEVDYAVGWPWSRDSVGVQPSRVRLVRPVLRASLGGGELSFGRLDPLIEEFRKRPPRPDAKAPLVLVEGGRVLLMTERGPVELLADARVEDKRLTALDARLPPTRLISDSLAAEGLEARLSLRTRGDVASIQGQAGAARFRWGPTAAEAARLVFAGDLPYPDTAARRAEGPARLNLDLAAGRFSSGGTAARDLRLDAVLNGDLAGWLEQASFRGAGRLRARAESLSAPGLNGRGVTADLPRGAVELALGERLRWRVEGPASLAAAGAEGAGLRGEAASLRSTRLVAGGSGRAWEASGPVAVRAGRLAWGNLSLRAASAEGRVDVVSQEGVRVEAAAALAARGAWPLLGPRARDDLPELAALKQALADFGLSAPNLRVRADEGGAWVWLERPVVARPANGGALTIAASGPVFDSRLGAQGGGALSLVAQRGGGLPAARIAVPEWRLTPAGFTARLGGEAALDFGVGRGVRLESRGLLTSGGGRLTYAADGCSPVSLQRLELGENDVTDVSGALCDARGPLVTVADGGWRVNGRLRAVKAQAPFLALSIADASGALQAFGGPRGVGLDLTADAATVADATQPVRFNPLMASGRASLRGDRWTGAFDLARLGSPLGRLSLAHDGRSGAGGIDIRSTDIAFAPEGLQPADLTPLVSDWIKPPVTGSVRFEGRVDWTPTGGTSGGLLTIPSLDFTSPAGAVKGLAGQVRFVSLAPLITAPDQTVTVAELDSVSPATNVRVGFALDGNAITVGGGELSLAGGTVRVEPFAIPLAPGEAYSGVLVLERVQLGEIIKGAGFQDKVELDAVVSGRVPFTVEPGKGVRVTGGQLTAVQPGRLEIQREALSGLEAGGGGEDVPPNVVQDLAYQAMENLAYDILSAEVNSLEEGRLGVLFRIKGRFDPPERQELRIGIQELLNRSFMNRLLPLPSGTEVDLTLDTNLNINQLVSDLLALNRARAGEAAPPNP